MNIGRKRSAKGTVYVSFRCTRLEREFIRKCAKSKYMTIREWCVKNLMAVSV
jgi:hypothetical protein